MTPLERLRWAQEQIELAMPLHCDYCGGKFVKHPRTYEHGSNCPMTKMAREIELLEKPE